MAFNMNVTSEDVANYKKKNQQMGYKQALSMQNTVENAMQSRMAQNPNMPAQSSVTANGFGRTNV